MTYQLNIIDAIAEGERLRQEGLQRAVDHAQADFPEWKERAYRLFTEWLSRMPQGAEFRTETFRLWVKERIEEPPSLRAFGFLPIKAAREGMIKKVGHDTVTNPLAHRCFCSLWRKE